MGSTVVIRRGAQRPLERSTLVGPHEGAPAQARISLQSPLGRALVGRRPGEAVSVEMPGGLQTVPLDEVRAPGATSIRRRDPPCRWTMDGSWREDA